MFGKKTKASLAFVRESLAEAEKTLEAVLEERDAAEQLALKLRAEMNDLGAALFPYPRDVYENLATRVRELREKERVVDEFQAMCAGKYDADAALLRKLACALGTSHLNSASVIARADQLATVRTENQGLMRKLAFAQEQVHILEGKLLDGEGA